MMIILDTSTLKKFFYFLQIWPLRLIDLNNEEQVNVVFEFLRTTPQVIHFYLARYVQ